MGLAKEKDFFEEFGLEVKQGEVEVGQTYPIFGMITKLVSEVPGDIVVEINYGILAKMNLADSSRIELLKQRAFETGIFVSTVTSKEPQLKVDCKTVIFGKPQTSLT